MSYLWHLKQIHFGQRPVKIITQNANGPCSFIAICNILLLRGQIDITPHDRPTVSYDFLSQLLAEYLLSTCPDVDISAALSIMPTTTKGLDLNPQFTRTTAFSPASTGELDLFAQAGIQLVHGWLVDPHSPEADLMAHITDYDAAVTLIADADYITKGRLLGHPNEASTSAGPSSSPSRTLHHSGTYSDEQQRKIELAMVAQQFLDATKSQLTYHGLFQLASTLEPGSLVALFRNAHLSVVYKSPVPDPNTDDTTVPSIPNATIPGSTHTPDSALYALVTDDVFLHEPSIVWERLEDVDGGWSTFVDSDFHLAVPVGGDVAGQTAEGTLRRMEMAAGANPNLADQELARQLQAEEDERAQQVYQQRQRRADEQAVREAASGTRTETRTGDRWWKPKAVKGKLKQCVVM